MMFSSLRHHHEDDSVALSIGSDSLNERLEASLNPTVGSDIRTADVLCGRGKTSFNHTGNKWFRDAVSASMDEYLKAENRFEKSLIVHSIMDRVKKEGGRFLKKDHEAGKWVELSEAQAKEKVGHAVRDAVNALEGRKKKCKRPCDTFAAPGSESPLSVSPRTQQVRSVQNVLASISSAAASAAETARSDMPPRPPLYSFNDSSTSNLLPEMQSVSLRPPPGALDMYGYETEIGHGAPLTTEAGHASWSGSASVPAPIFVPLSRHHSIPLVSSSANTAPRDYFQSEEILRRQSVDPMKIEHPLDIPFPGPVHDANGTFTETHYDSMPRPSVPPIEPMDTDDKFLERIQSVLGPLQSDLRDPMESYLRHDVRRNERNRDAM